MEGKKKGYNYSVVTSYTEHGKADGAFEGVENGSAGTAAGTSVTEGAADG